MAREEARKEREAAKEEGARRLAVMREEAKWEARIREREAEAYVRERDAAKEDAAKREREAAKVEEAAKKEEEARSEAAKEEATKREAAKREEIAKRKADEWEAAKREEAAKRVAAKREAEEWVAAKLRKAARREAEEWVAAKREDTAKREVAKREEAAKWERETTVECSVRSRLESSSGLVHSVGSASRYDSLNKSRGAEWLRREWEQENGPDAFHSMSSQYLLDHPIQPVSGFCYTLPEAGKSPVLSTLSRYSNRLRRELEGENGAHEFAQQSESVEVLVPKERRRRCERKLDAEGDVEKGNKKSSSQAQAEKEIRVKKTSANESRVKNDDKRSWRRPSFLLKSLLLLGMLLLGVFCLAYIGSSSSITFPTHGVGSMLKIHISVSHPSRFSFGKLMISKLPSTSFHMLTRSSRLPNCSIHMTGCECGDDPCTPT